MGASLLALAKSIYYISRSLQSVLGSVPHRIALTPTRKPYRIGPLFTHKNGDFGAISITERSCTATILRVDCHISDRFLPLFITVFLGVWTVGVGEKTGTH